MSRSDSILRPQTRHQRKETDVARINEDFLCFLPFSFSERNNSVLFICRYSVNTDRDLKREYRLNEMQGTSETWLPWSNPFTVPRYSRSNFELICKSADVLLFNPESACLFRWRCLICYLKKEFIYLSVRVTCHW